MVDVVVVGAGVAGMSAASALRTAGLETVVLEASARIGGRAHTVTEPVLGGAWLDHGAIWLHSSETNPLVPIARAAGERLIDSDGQRHERTFVAGRPATGAELADYDGATARFYRAADWLLGRGGPDGCLADVARSIPDDPWARSIETWEGPIICAVDAEKYSLSDWKRNVLPGTNKRVAGGIGAFVARRLGIGLDVRLQTPVRRVRWDGPGCVVVTDAGKITARACIVTVSTGVLAAGGIQFHPELPEDVGGAIFDVPMGLAMKVALPAVGADRLDLPDDTLIDRQWQAGDPAIILTAWPRGKAFVSAWIGGDLAWELTRAGDAAAIGFVRDYLRKLFGGRIDALFAAGVGVVTQWGGDALFRGAYAYARPGAFAARDRIKTPVAGGRLILTGEAANTDGLAGTLGGAWLEGARAAEAVKLSLGR